MVMNLNPMALGARMPPPRPMFGAPLNEEQRELDMYKQFLESRGESADPIQSLVRGTARTPQMAETEQKMQGIQSLMDRRNNIGQKFQGMKQVAQDRGVQFNPLETAQPAAPGNIQPVARGMQPQIPQMQMAQPPQMGAPAGAPSPTEMKVTGAGGGILSEARKYLGTPYVWGGTSPKGFDCSGYTQYVAKSVGLNIPRTAEAQRAWFEKSGRYSRSIADAKPGDMLYFSSKASPSGRHTGIYIGNGKYINAAGKKSGVKISNVNNLPLLGVGKV